MRKTILGGIAVTASLGAALASGAFAGPPAENVTGGGQIIASSQQGGGPGDTLALQAQAPSSSSTAATGNVQYVPHASGGPKWHGTVTCLQVNGNVARIGGTYTPADSSSSGFFKIVLTDTDQGGPQSGTDTVYINPNASSADCTSQDQNENQLAFGRGNFTIHS